MTAQGETDQLTSEATIKVKDTTANPAPIALTGFGIAAVLMNLHNAGLYEMGSVVIAAGVFSGGVAQVITGLLEWKKNNIFGATAFTSYGFFWLSLIALMIMPEMGWSQPAEGSAMVAYLLMWMLFSVGMFIGTLKINRALQVVFGTTALLLLLLAIADATSNATLKHIGGYVGILSGLSGLYTALAQVINELYGRTVVPLGPVK